jgi:hypothetical protein
VPGQAEESTRIGLRAARCTLEERVVARSSVVLHVTSQGYGFSFRVWRDQSVGRDGLVATRTLDHQVELPPSPSQSARALSLRNPCAGRGCSFSRSWLPRAARSEDSIEEGTSTGAARDSLTGLKTGLSS